MNRTTLLLSALALSSCTTTEIGHGIRKAAELSVEGCRGYLIAYPDAGGKLARVCREVLAATALNFS